MLRTPKNKETWIGKQATRDRHSYSTQQNHKETMKLRVISGTLGPCTGNIQQDAWCMYQSCRQMTSSVWLGRKQSWLRGITHWTTVSTTKSQDGLSKPIVHILNYDSRQLQLHKAVGTVWWDAHTIRAITLTELCSSWNIYHSNSTSCYQDDSSLQVFIYRTTPSSCFHTWGYINNTDRGFAYILAKSTHKPQQYLLSLSHHTISAIPYPHLQQQTTASLREEAPFNTSVTLYDDETTG